MGLFVAGLAVAWLLMLDIGSVFGIGLLCRKFWVVWRIDEWMDYVPSLLGEVLWDNS